MDIFMDEDQILPLPEGTISVVAGPKGDAATELERALRLLLPSLNDHRNTAQTLRMILRKRGFDVMRDMRAR